MLGHKVFVQSIEVDQTKIKASKKLPPPTSIKNIQNFLGYARFCRIFIKDFLKMTKPLCMLHEKDVLFVFSEKCISTFQTLKFALVSTPIINHSHMQIKFNIDHLDYNIVYWGNRVESLKEPLNLMIYHIKVWKRVTKLKTSKLDQIKTIRTITKNLKRKLNNKSYQSKKNCISDVNLTLATKG